MGRRISCPIAMATVAIRRAGYATDSWMPSGQTMCPMTSTRSRLAGTSERSYGKPFNRLRSFLLLIGRDWDPEKLAVPGDSVRLEIDEALRHDKLLVPVLVGMAEMPAADELPDEIGSIAYLNAAPLRSDPDFSYGLVSVD